MNFVEKILSSKEHLASYKRDGKSLDECLSQLGMSYISSYEYNQWSFAYNNVLDNWNVVQEKLKSSNKNVDEYKYIKNQNLLAGDQARDAKMNDDAEKEANEIDKLVNSTMFTKECKLKSTGKPRAFKNVLNNQTLNANAYGAEARANSRASVINTNIGNLNAQGVSARAGAQANLVNISAGNVGVTGVELNGTINATGASINVGNVSVTGASGDSGVNITGTGIKAFNVSVSGPGVSGPAIKGSGQASFGNISIGGGGSSGGSTSQNNDGQTPFLDRMKEKYPNTNYIYGSNGFEKKIAGHNNDGQTNASLEEENTIVKQEKCKDHSQKVTCMKCISSSCSANIKKLSNDDKKIYGFK